MGSSLTAYIAMRLIFLDTETTGLTPKFGDRIVEIACVEMINGLLTGRELHYLLNPERPIPAFASEIHGITDEAVQGRPRFSDIANELVEFIAGDVVVAHNAPFDMEFLRAEFEFESSDSDIAHLSNPELVIDTLPTFRKLHPGKRCSLAALCKRYGVCLSEGQGWHSALTDAKMLALLWPKIGINHDHPHGE
jgi:DNA polymerase-3 subunit epsilon